MGNFTVKMFENKVIFGYFRKKSLKIHRDLTKIAKTPEKYAFSWSFLLKKVKFCILINIIHESNAQLDQKEENKHDLPHCHKSAKTSFCTSKHKLACIFPHEYFKVLGIVLNLFLDKNSSKKHVSIFLRWIIHAYVLIPPCFWPLARSMVILCCSYTGHMPVMCISPALVFGPMAIHQKFLVIAVTTATDNCHV